MGLPVRHDAETPEIPASAWPHLVPPHRRSTWVALVAHQSGYRRDRPDGEQLWATMSPAEWTYTGER
jgi:hypothetical protein